MSAPREGPLLYLVGCAAPPVRHVGELVTLLHRAGWRVCVILTPQAARWVDGAALAAQTGHPVRHEHRMPDDQDSLPRADAVAMAPATFNTINKWAAGISDTFALGILNEAIGLGLPILLAPYVKPSLAAHPAFELSLDRLAACGVHVLRDAIRRPPEQGSPGFDWSPVLDAARHLGTNQPGCAP